MRRRPFFASLAGLGLLGAGRASAQAPGAPDAGVVGEWRGTLAIGSRTLRMRVVVSPDGKVAAFSPDQGDARIAGKALSLTTGDVRFSLPAAGASFAGRLEDGRLAGVFTQRGTDMPLALEKGGESWPPPAQPVALTQSRLDALRGQTPAMAAAWSHAEGRKPTVLVSGLRAVDHAEPVTANDKWHVGSITKSMTATLVAVLAEKGLIRWDDTVGAALGKVAPDMRDAYRDVSFLHLLSHRSGLPGNIPLARLGRFSRNNPDPREERRAYAAIALAQAPKGPRETTFEYANNGYVIAGAMLEARLEQGWESLVRTHLFAPLGMEGAGLGAPSATGRIDQPLGHTVGMLTGKRMALQPGKTIVDNPAVLGPAGTVHARPADMLAYLSAHRDRSALLPRQAWARLHTPPFGGDYALGWMLRKDGALWHNGSNTFWFAEAGFHAARGVAAFAGANDAHAETQLAVGSAWMSAMAG